MGEEKAPVLTAIEVDIRVGVDFALGEVDERQPAGIGGCPLEELVEDRLKVNH